MSLPSAKIVLFGLALGVMTGWAQGGHAQSAQASSARAPAIVARVLPSVVSITVRQIEQDQFNGSVLKAGMASGLIVNRQGHILTSNHVVEGFDEFKITLPDGRTFRGSFVGGDRFTDLAVLKIEGKNPPPLPLGDSSKLAIGETVITIGNPIWIEGGPTVTMGVVRVSVTPQLGLTNDLKVESGALVVRVERGGPAEAVGVKADDFIVPFYGKVVTDLHHFHASLADRKPEDTVEVTVWRDGQTLIFSSVLGEDR